MHDQHMDFYQGLRNRVVQWANSGEAQDNKWTEYILIVPDLFHLLWKLTLDPEVPRKTKIKLGIALAYFISPIDFIPEGILGPLGYTDDLVITALVLNMMINETDPYLVHKHWAGEHDILILVKRIIETADQMIGRGLVNKIKVLLKLSGR
ncbi:MAG: YkvA family protein [Syntrophomonadaceae bacterium]